MAFDIPTVENIFIDVRATFFPRWDPVNAWRVEFLPRSQMNGNTGYCETKVKRIQLDYDVLRFTLVGLKTFLIHEICHDVAAANHQVRWASRMEVAATRAQKDDDLELARSIRMEIYSYCNGNTYYAAVGSLGPHFVSVTAKSFSHLPRTMPRTAGLSHDAR